MVATAAALSAGYVLSSAPSVDTGWFWAGIFAGGVGAVTALQGIMAERRARAARRLAAKSVSADQSAGGGPSTSSGERDAPTRD